MPQIGLPFTKNVVTSHTSERNLPIVGVYAYHIFTTIILYHIMCEFCSLGPSSGKNKDSEHAAFECFYCPTAVDAAVQQALKIRKDGSSSNDTVTEEDDDGT